MRWSEPGESPASYVCSLEASCAASQANKALTFFAKYPTLNDAFEAGLEIRLYLGDGVLELTSASRPLAGRAVSGLPAS